MIKQLFEKLISDNMVQAFRLFIERTYTVELEMELTKEEFLYIERIFVPENQRERGIGSAALNDIITYADQHDLIITTSPDAIKKTDQKRLEGFYKRYGFKYNKGSDKNPSIKTTMYRLPQG